MLNTILAILFVVLSLCTTLQLLSSATRKYNLHPEIIRKLLHVVMGCLTMTFPFIFHEPWPVVALSIFSSIFIAVLKTAKSSGWGSVVCAKGRTSIGEVCFPLAIGLLFVLARGNLIMYLIPIIVLTLADAASALIGMRYGSIHYEVVNSKKSIEGSMAFFLIAFAGSFIPLMYLTSISRPEALLVALTLGLLATMFEGVAWHGLDNLIVPLGCYFVLKTHIGIPIDRMLVQLLVLVGLLVFVIVARHRTTLNGGALLGAGLFSYASYVIGGWAWLVIPLVMFLGYRKLLPRRFHQMENTHSVYGVISVASVGIIWLLFAEHLDVPNLIYPYTLAFASHGAIMAVAHMRSTALDRPHRYAILYSVLKSWCLLFIPLLLIQGISRPLLLYIFFAPFCIGLPTVAFYLSNSKGTGPITSKRRWVRQAVFAALGSLLGLIPFALFVH